MCVRAFSRFLDNYVRVHPPIEDDGSNLSEVLRDIWSKTKHEAPPMEALLGIKTIYVRETRMQHAAKPTLQSPLFKA